MAVHKILLDDDFEEDFSLIAIHCSQESYKMAYFLNKYVNLRLQRKRTDLDYSNNGMEMTFPLFKFEDLFQYTDYYLIGNKCQSAIATVSDGELFAENAAGRMVYTYLLPEFKKVDFFLKIESDFKNIPLRETLTSINKIKEVVSAYEVETSKIKSISNLIFN